MKLVARGVTLEWPRRPLVMGIVNLGADSFSGDGIVEIDRAVARARELVWEGADIIDIGAESARTNREAIGEEEEAGKLVSFIERWEEEIPNSKFQIPNKRVRELEKGENGENAIRSVSPLPEISSDCLELGAWNLEFPLLSINTWHPAVARAALAAGGHLLNDIGALPTDENARICAETGAALLIMHSIGAPKVAHTHVGYDDVMARLDEFFAEKIALAEAAGLSRDAIVLDPGIDFAKQRDDNLRIYRELDRLQKFTRPILLPVSRKTVIGDVLGLPNPADRDAGTVACIVQGMLRGAAIFRVHNVRAAAQAVRMIAAVENATAPGPA
jgi:dihydropteroate synthase